MPASNAVALYLLFAPGKRPHRTALKDFSLACDNVHISHDPVQSPGLHLVGASGQSSVSSNKVEAVPDRVAWLEMLCDGLTFDLRGLAPGDAMEPAVSEQRFDVDRDVSLSRYEALELVPGRHLESGAIVAPVVRSMIALANDLVKHFEDIEAVIWAPAKTVMGRRYFESIMTAWLEGGAFPALGLTSFRETIDGALQSDGLSFWINQELRIEPPLSSEKVEATRLGVRLINHLVLVGGLDASERLTAPDGDKMVLRPSLNGKFVRVTHE